MLRHRPHITYGDLTPFVHVLGLILKDILELSRRSDAALRIIWVVGAGKRSIHIPLIELALTERMEIHHVEAALLPDLSGQGGVFSRHIGRTQPRAKPIRRRCGARLSLQILRNRRKEVRIHIGILRSLVRLIPFDGRYRGERKPAIEHAKTYLQRGSCRLFRISVDPPRERETGGEVDSRKRLLSLHSKPIADPDIAEHIDIVLHEACDIRLRRRYSILSRGDLELARAASICANLTCPFFGRDS